MLEILWMYLLVFLLSALPLLEAVIVIPFAIFAGMPAIQVTIVALTGNLLTVYVIIIFIEQIKNWRQKRKTTVDKKENRRSQRAERIWKKYGLPGLAIIGPLIVGSHITALMSLTFGGTKKGVTYWLTSSLVFWCIVAAILAHLGFDLFNTRDRDLF
ncbi:small multi-drug export protein [Bacillus sp. JCM 19034]|uniref:small multi-drug export protein n=1 Tax=Bacillus sp. JCM 19034 TaxID=1481928 RepID=UPI00078489FA|nr:small multi-drug export protein [Bacillus sp. JCM 19034]